MHTDFPTFFRAAQDNKFGPYDFQERFANASELPNLLRAPTGSGKTATAVLGWLWRRTSGPTDLRETTPRRLVFCLPMRSLVSQTEGAVVTWVSNLAKHGHEVDVDVHVLMGGAVDESWESNPDRNAILIGTQDQLLSRALNRGYAMSRYRWSVHFALLNNDVLWVMDEVQLMGVGLSTSAQLQGFDFPTAGPRRTLWMSATLDESQLQTVDNRRTPVRFKVDPNEERRLQKRANAVKRLHAVSDLFEKKPRDYAAKLAPFVVDKHLAHGGRTLVVLNQVDRAIALVEAIGKLHPELPLHLIHSRYRPAEREQIETLALEKHSEAILVATQAIEAGVDITSRTLVTELASWSSMVQRFGRCNRAGECTDGADIYWIDLPDDDKVALPYDTTGFKLARNLLEQTPDAAPSKLVPDPGPHRPASPVLRRKDLIDLFDTTSDLSGFDIDVGRFVRDSGPPDVQVAWRDWRLGAKGADPTGEARHVLRREELCRVALHRFSKAYDKTPRWTWDPLAKGPRDGKKRGAWVKRSSGVVKPGDTLLLHVSAGGYHMSGTTPLGFTGSSKHKPSSVPPEEASELAVEPEADEDEPDSLLGGPSDFTVSLRDHSRDVRTQATRLEQSLGGDLPWEKVVLAAHWHDVGKAHPAWQDMITSGMTIEPGPWAKRPRGAPRPSRIRRRFFRHELASALAYLGHDDPDDLVAFLIAAHHGKVRTAIRSRPQETPNARVASSMGLDPDAMRIALGVYDGESLPSADLGEGLTTRDVLLDLTIMDVGGGGRSWVERLDSLLHEWGPYQLAFLEMLVRVADWRASAEPEHTVPWEPSHA